MRTKPTCMVCAYEFEDPYIFLQDRSQWRTPEMRYEHDEFFPLSGVGRHNVLSYTEHDESIIYI
jgi:hypothetical protein